jgi:signal transduction histidine kinase
MNMTIYGGSKMNNMSVERLVSRGFIAATIVLVLLGGIAWRSAVKSDEASSQVMRTHQVLTSVGQIMLNLARADAAQRDYDSYAENYYLKKRDESLLNVVRSVEWAEQNFIVPEQQEHLRQLKMLIVRRMEIFSGDQDFRKPRSRIVVAGFNSSPPIMEQIHHNIDQMVKMENTLLLEREAENAFQRKVETMSFAMLGMLTPLALFFLFLHIRRAMRLIRDEDVLLKQSKLELEEASRMKAEILAHMSHEIRTPINAIMGFSDSLRDGRHGKLTQTQAEYVSHIYSSGEHMLALVNNILDLSKIEAGKAMPDLEQVDISELLENSVYIIREQAASHHVRLHLDVQPGFGDIHIDPVKTRQILYNLLSNAVKFTPDGGQVRLRACRVTRSDVAQVSGYWPSRTFPLSGSAFMEFLEISVADSGLGIPSDGLEQLFQSYSRIDSGSELKFEGTGLGLMLVKNLAELHGGTVAVESAEGYGSRFIVWLPLRTDAGAVVEPDESSLQKLVPESIWKARKVCAKALLELAQQRTFVKA